MSIILKIISYQRLTPGQQDCYRCKQGKFSIGRSSDNDWTLPDPQRFMSGVHCHFEQRDGTWYVTDTSTNGVFINNADERLGQDQSAPLAHGDRIRVGDYELQVVLDQPRAADQMEETLPGMSIAGEAADFATPGEPAATPPDDGMKPVNTPLSQMDQSLLHGSMSIDDLYALDEEEEADEPPSLASKGNSGPVLRQHFAAPKAQAPAEPDEPGPYELDVDSIPENWDEDTGVSRPAVDIAAAGRPPEAAARPAADAEPAAALKPTPEPPAAAPAAAHSALAAFAAGAGLDPAELKVTDETAFFRDLGTLLNTVTEGLMQALSSRGQVKSEFRLEQTMIAPVENNPFKFSTSAREAMTRLFAEDDRAYLSGPAAAQEAIDDINAHQMAVLAGTEAALRSVLRRFQPAHLEERFEGQSAVGKLLPAIHKARCWDFYRVLYDELAEAADEDFQQLFGNEFSKAYKDQLERLKAARKDR